MMKRLVIALTLLPSLTQAQDTPPPKVELWAWRVAVFAAGTRSDLWGARLAGYLPISNRLAVVGRADVTGVPEQLVPDNPKTYQALEVYGGATWTAWRGATGVDIGPALVAGTTLGVGTADKTPHAWGLGVRVGHSASGGWVYALVGKHDAAGSGLRVLVSAHVPLKSGFALVGDLVSDGFARAGIAYRIGGSQ